MKRKNSVVDFQGDRYRPEDMNKGRDAFKPLKHKTSKKAFSDLEYLLLLGEQASLGEEEFKRLNPHREYTMKGIDPDVLRFAMSIYKAKQDGISDRELAEYIRDSISIDA